MDFQPEEVNLSLALLKYYLFYNFIKQFILSNSTLKNDFYSIKNYFGINFFNILMKTY